MPEWACAWMFVCRRPLAQAAHAGREYKFVQALDMESTDLLSELEECVAFIEAGRQAGGVLVHWSVTYTHTLQCTMRGLHWLHAFNLVLVSSIMHAHR